MNGIFSMSSSTDIELRKIFVGGLKADTQDDDFRNFFARYGHIEDCVHIRYVVYIVGYKAKRHKCSYALFAIFCSEDAADQGLPSCKV